MKSAISAQTKIDELVAQLPIAADVMRAFGLGCAGCGVSKYETIEEGARAHGLRNEPILRALEQARVSGNVPPRAGGVPGARDDRAHRRRDVRKGRGG
jgi:hybrid cluster-associated redox disulfide protein